MLAGGLAFILAWYYGNLGYLTYSKQVVGYAFLAWFLSGLTIIVGRGMLRGRGWSWTGGLLLAVGELLLSTFALGSSRFPTVQIIELATNIVIIFYLMQPHVRTYFGKDRRTITPLDSANLPANF
jgi:hypothetical protein